MPLIRTSFGISRWFGRTMSLMFVAALVSAGFAQSSNVQGVGQRIAVDAAKTLPVAIRLDDAIALARANEPVFAVAVAANRNAELDRSIARATLLPSVSYHNQYIYTQPLRAAAVGDVSIGSAATGTAPRFVSGNTVHEYVSQGLVSETIGAQQINAVSRAAASAAVAKAELEVAQRGLVASVTELFYAAYTAVRRMSVAERAADEAANLTKLTEQRETVREVAHADVVKAQLQQQQRDRDLVDARLQASRSRLELAVLLFADPRTPYTLVIPEALQLVPTRADVEAAFSKHNPELSSALASAHLADLNVFAARAAYFPELALNYSYGIDAAQFAAKARDGSRNLGYSASVTLDIPIWDWLATHDRVKQTEINRQTARTVLSNTQRKQIAMLEENYAETVAAYDQLESLNHSVDTATESLRLTRLSYTAGESAILSVVDAENSLTAAELAREDGIVRYQNALANLQLLTGTI